MTRRIQRQRTKGWRMPEGAVYVGRPSSWGNPFAWNDERAPWMALSLGERADAVGRRAAAVKLYRWWITGAKHEDFPLDTEEHGGPAIEYSNGVVRSFRSVASGLGVFMWLREPLAIPAAPRPPAAPGCGRPRLLLLTRSAVPCGRAAGAGRGMTRLRLFLFGCEVCGMPAWWQAVGHGRRRHLAFCPRRPR